MMLLILTHVRMPKDHLEMAEACANLLVMLNERHCYDAADYAGWEYICSIPQQKEYDVEYVHVFHHPLHASTKGPLTLVVPATDGWWPDASCASLMPPRSERRTNLRLVS